MRYGPWHRSADREFLYSFSSSDDTYVLAVTDFRAVFEEELTADDVERRGEQLQCPFSLNTANQRSAFGTMILSLLSKDASDFNVRKESAVFVRTDDDVAFHWHFNLTELPAHRSAAIFANLAINLFGALDNMGLYVSSMQELIADKDAVIRGLENASSRKVDYVVPKSLEPALNSARSVSVSGSVSGSGSRGALPDGVQLAEQHWPMETVSPLHFEMTEDELDSDATHESPRRTSADNIWAHSALASGSSYSELP